MRAVLLNEQQLVVLTRASYIGSLAFDFLQRGDLSRPCSNSQEVDP